MKIKYETAEIEVILLGKTDILTDSPIVSEEDPIEEKQ